MTLVPCKIAKAVTQWFAGEATPRRNRSSPGGEEHNCQTVSQNDVMFCLSEYNAEVMIGNAEQLDSKIIASPAVEFGSLNQQIKE